MNNLLFRIVRSSLVPVMLAGWLLASCLAQGSRSGVSAARPGDWPEYGGALGQHFSPLHQIDAENVSRLQEKWRFDVKEDGSGGWEANPLIIGKAIYVCTPLGRVIKLDAETGTLLWRFDSGVSSTQPCRGVSYWTDGRNAQIFAGAMNFLYSLDAATGKPNADFGDKGRIDLRRNLRGDFRSQSVALTTPGVIYKDLIILGGRTPETYPAPPGDIRAYDVRTGTMRWIFHTIPHPGEPGAETWPHDAWKYAGAANNWAGMAVDRGRGIVFVPTGSAVFDFYGGDRTGDDLYANTLLALNASTGKLLWHFQAVHHDIWDRDLASAPTLVTVMHNGHAVDAVAQTSKSGFVFVLRRDNGKPLLPIEERPFPASTVPGEHAAATQPVPVLPAPFTRQLLTENDLTERTPAAHAWAAEQYKLTGNRGQFVPFELNHPMLLVPGFDGGGQWGGSAFDPASHVLYVNGNNIAWIAGLLPQQTTGSAGAETYAARCSLCHGANREGQPPSFPSLIGVSDHLKDSELTALIRNGKGRMPAFPDLNESQVAQLLSFLHTGSASGADSTKQDDSRPAPRELASNVETAAEMEAAHHLPYSFTGYKKWMDPDGYPGVAPPWGTLNAIDLSTGKYLWTIPFGTYPELVAQGMKDTGSENIGGPLVTAGGLVFIGASIQDNLFHAYDARTGKLLWQDKLPFAGLATPATFEVGGQQYVAIAAGGGKDVPQERRGGILVVYSLPSP